MVLDKAEVEHAQRIVALGHWRDNRDPIVVRLFPGTGSIQTLLPRRGKPKIGYAPEKRRAGIDTLASLRRNNFGRQFLRARDVQVH